MYMCRWRPVVNANHSPYYFWRQGPPLNLVFIDSATLVSNKPKEPDISVFPALGLQVNECHYYLFNMAAGNLDSGLCLLGEHFHD